MVISEKKHFILSSDVTGSTGGQRGHGKISLRKKV